MTQTNTTIGIDIDGTTLDSCPKWWEWLYHMTMPSNIPKDIDEFICKERAEGRAVSYNLTQYFPDPINHQVDKFDFWRNTGVYDTIEPIAGAVEYITKLMEYGFDVVFVTHNKGNGGRSKYLNIERHFDSYNFDYIVTKEKYRARIDCLIDDRNDFLNPCQKMGIQGFQIHSPFSQRIELHPDVISCRNWGEVYQGVIDRYGK